MKICGLFRDFSRYKKRYILRIKSGIWSDQSVYIKIGLLLMTTAIISVVSGLVLGWIMMLRIQHLQGGTVFLFTTLHAGITNFITASCILVLIDICFFKRIYGLNRSIKKAGHEKDFSVRLKVDGNDEISSLSAGINALLKYLEDCKKSDTHPKKI